MHEARVKSGERSNERAVGRAAAGRDGLGKPEESVGRGMRDPRPNRDYIYAIIVSAARVAGVHQS